MALHAPHSKVGIAQQAVLPTTVPSVIACTLLADWAVFAAGVVAALAVATGATLTARMVARQERATASAG